MGSARETVKLSTIDDGQDIDTEIEMDDDELLFDDFDGEEPESEIPDSEIEVTASVEIAGWRRIEMLRESKRLKSELADMDDDDWFEFTSDDSFTSHSI